MATSKPILSVPKVSTSSSKPELPASLNPRLPWDVLRIIFAFVDTRTLAVLGRVSYDTLLDTSPQLYNYIVIRSVNKLSKLMGGINRKKPNPSSARITPHLSLQQCHSLLLDFSDLYSYLPSDYLALFILSSPSATSSSSRLPSIPLPLTNLTVFLHPSFKQILLLLSNLLPHFNPLNVTYSSSSPFDNLDYGELVSSEFGPSNLLSWTRLRTLTFRRVLPVRVDPNKREPTLASIPREFLGRLERIAFDPSFGAGGPGFGRAAMREFVMEWEEHVEKLGLEGLGDGVFVLLVRDEGRKREVEGMIEGRVREELRRMLRVEVA